MTTNSSGSSVSSRAVVVVRGVASARPSIGGIDGEAPVATTNAPADRRRPPMAIVDASSKRARPCSTPKPWPSATSRYLSRRSRSTRSARAALSAGRSTPSARVAIPGKGWWPARKSRSAGASIALEGMQPVLTQVPPTVADSTSATLAPSSVARIAAAKPAAPEPRTTRSYPSRSATISISPGSNTYGWPDAL